MNFSQWIEENGLSRAEVARRLWLSRGNITDLCNRAHWPSLSVIERIIDLTDGEVGPNDFLPDEIRKKLLRKQRDSRK